MITKNRLPEHYENYPEHVMTNFDHSIDDAVAEVLKQEAYYAQYAGWNFCGYVWWQNNHWCCEVWSNKSYDETHEAETLEDIMHAISDVYGYD